MELARCCLLLFLGLSVTCSSEGEAENSVEIIEGDIAVDPPSEEDNKPVQRDALRDLGKIWQDRKVPYTIHSSIDGNTSAQIESVMEQYMNKTCVQFIDVTGNTTSVKTYLHIKKLSGCWSYVGRVFTGEQELSIGQGCEYDGIIIHEFMHALGFYHEQSRSDRDDFVTIMWENIKTDKYNNFKKQLSEAVQTFKTEYDYGSVMHYGKNAFSKNGLATIVPRKNVSIGQRIGFSNLDLQEINALYQCNKTGGGLSEWSDWSPCLGSGSSMFKERQRFCFETDRSKCPGVNSRGLMFEKKDVSCSDPECVVKGHWSRWSEWSFCDTTSCGSYGSTTRTRTCTNPTPRCGGPACPSNNTERTSCYAGNCIGPDDCEFENERQITCHWHSISGYSLKWIRNKGSTPSVDTGPTGDTTDKFYGKGHYMYVEASNPAKQGQKARMCSKEFHGPAKQRLTFRYHSYVVSSTKLTVLLKNSTGEETVLWTKTGLERNEWLNATLNITNNYNFGVCFEYERGSSYRGDIAVDDIHFKDLGYCAEHKPCKNNASCTNLIGENYECNCTNEYTGRNCSEKIIPCQSNPCLNNGTCLNVYGDLPPAFDCKCSGYYTGKRCELYNGYCAEHQPCKNNASCTSHIGSNYVCNCSNDYIGKNCSEKLVPCSSNPCHNSGTCSNIYSDKPPTFSCKCPDEYSGRTCKIYVDPCKNYIAKDEWQRGNQLSFDPSSKPPLCDLSLKTAWYRFISKSGGIIPMTCPAVNSCGTSHPIWASGSLPSAPGVSKALTACVRSKKSCCSEKWPIHVRKCSAKGSDFYLYKLPPPPRCPMSYCTDELNEVLSKKEKKISIALVTGISVGAVLFIALVVGVILVVKKRIGKNVKVKEDLNKKECGIQNQAQDTIDLSVLNDDKPGSKTSK